MIRVITLLAALSAALLAGKQTGAATCVGDCDASGEVTIDEIVTLTSMALEQGGACAAGDRDGNGAITIDEILAAVSHALLGCPPQPTPTPDPNVIWRPSTVYRAPENAPRGLVDLRGLIHAHSVYSHDACDNEPVKNGERDPLCFEDFRRDLCKAKHDFVMLTDHRDAFADYEFPELLLYREERGDEFVYRGGKPVASWAACPDQTRALIMAGNESGFMPVGLEEHVEGSAAERGSVYGSKTVESIEAQRAKGAVILVAHTEDWTVDQLVNLPLDGFEMYNIHANLLRNPAPAFQLLSRLGQNDPGLLHPDTALLGLISEDPRYLTRWGAVLARGVKRVTTLGTDCHRNTFRQEMADGERVDSYRRLMIWFSNHLLIRPEADGSWDDRHLKEALRAGRLYGAFEVMGYPEGFDYRATSGGQTYEMGDEVSLSAAPTLSVIPPQVRNLDPSRSAPELTVMILRAIPSGFETVASGAGAIDYQPTQPGAYRAEIRMRPLHLREDLRADADAILAKDFAWIYSNAIYVRE
jgi:hypothetical protein